MKRTAGVERVQTTPRVLAHVAGFETSAKECTQLVSRLRKGRDLLAGIDGDNPIRAEAEALWSALVMDLYCALRDSYARYAILRQTGDEGEAIGEWNRLMPNTDDLCKLGVKPLFDYYRGRMERPEWITDSETRLVSQVLWPPKPGEDVFDQGLGEIFDDIPF